MERSNAGDAATLRRFMLGRMPEEERAALEDRLLEDEDLFQQAVLIEDELADELVEGGLDEDDRAAFLALVERSPALRDRIDHAAALHAALRASRPARLSFGHRVAHFFTAPTTAWRPALAGALAATVAVGVWSQLQVGALRSDLEVAGRELDRARTEEAQAREALARERQDAARSRPPAAPLATFSLAPSSRSQDGRAVLRVPPAPGAVVLQLEADGGAGELRALLRTVRGEQVLVQNGLKAGAAGGLGVVAVSIPADLLTAGAYEVVLESRTPRGSWEMAAVYAFEVTRPR